MEEDKAHIYMGMREFRPIFTVGSYCIRYHFALEAENSTMEFSANFSPEQESIPTTICTAAAKLFAEHIQHIGQERNKRYDVSVHNGMRREEGSPYEPLPDMYDMNDKRAYHPLPQEHRDTFLSHLENILKQE